MMYFNDDKNNTNIDNDFGSKKKNSSTLKILIIILLSVVVLLAMYFLVFKNINIKEFKLEKTLALNGNTDIVINQYEEYIDPGYKAYDNKGNDLKSEVIISGNVDTSISGDYTISYTLDDIIKERHITVMTKKKQQTFLVLKGESTIFLKEGEEYTEPGYTVKDNLETDLESKVIVNGNVASIPGTYKLKYTVTNQSGITVSAERTIIVINSDIGINYEPQEKTNGKVKILVNIKDNYYDHTELPNKGITKDRYITYEVSENGTYKFIIYSKDETAKEKEIVINNIYKEPPSGTCEATLNRDSTKITVNAKGDMPITGYKYIIDGKESNFINEKSYTSKTLLGAKKVTVTVKDEAGNTVSLDCTIKNNNYHEIYINSDGKQCLSGYTCYIQNNYQKDVNYCSRAPSAAEPCGSISKHGCGVISMTTILSRYVKSPDGDPYDPYEMVEFIKSVCSSQCGDTAFKNTAKKFNLTWSGLYENIVKNIDKLVELLKNDTPVLIRVGGNSVYTDGGHFMSILAINDKNEVFLADTHKPETKSSKNSKFKVNSWVSLEELKNAFPTSKAREETWFRALGPPGFYNDNNK